MADRDNQVPEEQENQHVAEQQSASGLQSSWTRSLVSVLNVSYENVFKFLGKVPQKIKERGYQFFTEGYIHNIKGWYQYCSTIYYIDSFIF